MKGKYYPKGVCSTMIEYDIDSNDIIKNITVTNGCNGNLQGISRLVEGKSVDEVIERLKGIKCGLKNTSCPDQIALALLDYKSKK